MQKITLKQFFKRRGEIVNSHQLNYSTKDFREVWPMTILKLTQWKNFFYIHFGRGGRLKFRKRKTSIYADKNSIRIIGQCIAEDSTFWTSEAVITPPGAF